jgi:hypothetical protein
MMEWFAKWLKIYKDEIALEMCREQSARLRFMGERLKNIERTMDKK